MLTEPEKPIGNEKNNKNKSFDDTKNYKKSKSAQITQTNIDPETRADTITRVDSRSDCVGSNRCEETRSSLGRYAALGLDSSHIACGSFSSATGSSYLPSHEEDPVLKLI